jgi:hypothetical protein
MYLKTESCIWLLLSWATDLHPDTFKWEWCVYFIGGLLIIPFCCSYWIGCFWGPTFKCISFTFTLPCCIVIYLFLNKQPYALIIQILFRNKGLHFAGIFCAHHQEFSTVHSALVSFMQVSDDRFQAESSLLCLEAVIRKLHDTYQCRMYSRKLLMMGREYARNL